MLHFLPPHRRPVFISTGSFHHIELFHSSSCMKKHFLLVYRWQWWYASVLRIVTSWRLISSDSSRYLTVRITGCFCKCFISMHFPIKYSNLTVLGKNLQCFVTNWKTVSRQGHSHVPVSESCLWVAPNVTKHENRRRIVSYNNNLARTVNIHTEKKFSSVGTWSCLKCIN